ncbi:MAG: acetylxylan esterase [Abditibacteriaceae bacterium]
MGIIWINFSLPLPNNEPADFQTFWTQLYQETISTKLNIEMRPSNFSNDKIEVKEVYYDTLDKTRIGSWLAIPRRQKITKVQVQGHGYGGREAPDLTIPDNTAVLSGIELKETYVFRICAASLCSAASVMIELFPDCADTLYYSGSSYGGGMGCLMLPWDKRYTKASLGLISFCNHPIRVQCECVGSGSAVKGYYERHPEAMGTLCYFDGAFAVERIQVPTVFACAKFDPAVPPPGQFTAYNVCSATKRLSVFLTGHFDDQYAERAGEQKRHEENCRELGIE